ncbi:EIIBCA-Man [Alloiococcus otitis]|uniref:PTS system, Fru family, IIC component n=1 Tax=Alloiococcus otitis ATCC 51267 TaxID=883081 RepID=K9ERU5_9LACT|nr:fructose-specific PTS transporter subunit EIIC [Alloiococcus otitis]EKU93687.1 PTS system, Fru family, IIC component [Alloiococcus otitis ATCC 51267]SUU80283.1 EIIBCA-Man [Alloiococcus otitis]
MDKQIIAITSCPTGVAHTYMAAENLEKAGADLGVQVRVETHGSVGVENKFSQEEIDQAIGLIIAADTNIDKSRFEGLPIIEVSVREGINKPQKLIQDTLDQKGKIYSSGKAQSVKDQASNGGNENIVYRALMNGVSHMIPFVVTGGLLIALSLTLGGQPTEAGFVIPEDSIWQSINGIGEVAMSFMGPVLSAYIAYAIADRPGLVPGMVGGFIAVNESFYAADTNTGFIGAIITGFIAGYVALLIKKIPVPKAMNSVMPIIFIPIISSLVVGLLFIFLIGAPVASLFTSLTNWLANLQGPNMAILAAILGAMIAVDMGGPFNKTAFLFGVGLIADGEVSVMGAIAVAICIPPLATGLASLIYRHKFTKADQTTGIASLFMGFFGITEGAIPFAAKAPFRVIPSIVVGSSVGAIVASLTGVTDHVAHGGPIVAVLGAVDNVLMFFVAVLAGVVVATILIGLLMPKKELAVQGSAQPLDSNPPTQTKNPQPSFSSNQLNLLDLTNQNLWLLDTPEDNQQDLLDKLISLPELENLITNKNQVLQAIWKREEESSTGVGDGIAIPHAKSEAIKQARVLFARPSQAIDWNSMDGEPVNLIFLILVPEENQNDLHLKILQILARKLTDSEFRQKLLQVSDKEQLEQILSEIQ